MHIGCAQVEEYSHRAMPVTGASSAFHMPRTQLLYRCEWIPSAIHVQRSAQRGRNPNSAVPWCIFKHLGFLAFVGGTRLGLPDSTCHTERERHLRLHACNQDASMEVMSPNSKYALASEHFARSPMHSAKQYEHHAGVKCEADVQKVGSKGSCIGSCTCASC